jgi:hypothetical protein
MFIRHGVADYAKWKPYFDEDESVRREYGFTTHSVHRDAEDESKYILAFRVTDIDRAKKFAGSEALRSTMERAGVQWPVDFWFAEDVEDKSY